MTEVKKDTFRSQGKRVCNNYDMVRVVLDMTKIEYYKHLKPILKQSYNSEYVSQGKSCLNCKANGRGECIPCCVCDNFSNWEPSCSHTETER